MRWDKTWELCPHCETEVELDCALEPQVCPSCGRWICPCSLCDGCKKDCEIEQECRKLNDAVILIEKHKTFIQNVKPG